MEQIQERVPRRIALRNAAAETSAEVLDPTPIEVGHQERPLTLREEMRRFIVEQVSVHAGQQGVETFEEADDFEIEDGPDLSSQYTVQDMTLEGYPQDDLEGEPNEEDKQAENGQQEPPGEPEGESEAPGAVTPPPTDGAPPVRSQG